MNLRNQSYFSIPHLKILFSISLATLLSWLAFALVVYKLDPYTSSSLALPLFFVSLFFSLSGSFSLILFIIKRWKAMKEVYVKHIMISLRQGTLLSLCTNLCLLLLMFNLLRIWNGLLLVFIMMLIEFYMSGKDDLN